jgi:aryl-alcohol dehydrogenase-like predicted oxidoreductase
MRYRRLGHSGLKVSVVGLGGNTFGRSVDAQQTVSVVHTALDLGVNFFDTAELYSDGTSEEYLGRALVGRRDRALIATKTGWTSSEKPNESGASRAHILPGVHASLKRLNTDYIDVLQVHRWDPETPLEETLDVLNDLVRAGKVRYIGCSNFAAWRLVWSLWISDRRGWASFVSVQPEYNLLTREVETELLPACQGLGIGVIPFFPLGGGLLTGKYREDEPPPPGTRFAQLERFRNRFATPRNFAIVRELELWARARGHAIGELAIAWLLARPAVSAVITGVTKPEQVHANVRAADWELTPAEAEEVAALTPVE